MKPLYWVMANDGFCTTKVMGTYVRKGNALRKAKQFAEMLKIEVHYLQPYGELIWSNESDEQTG